MFYRLFLIFTCFALPAFAVSDDMYHNSGLPIPRYVSLKSNEINVRVGPGERYPIAWIYHRKFLPVEIVEEFGQWRKVRDIENAEGWVHKNLLNGARTALIRERKRPLYFSPDASSAEVMTVDPMVPGALLKCIPGWCRLAFHDHKGWIRRDFLWGVYKDEIIGED